MAAPPQQGMGPQFQSDTLSGVCNECIAQMPWATRKINGVIVVGTLIGMFLGGYTALDTAKIIQSYQIYRLFLSPFISSPGFGAIFNMLCILFIFAHGARVEMRKGSVFLAYAALFIALFANVLLFSFEAVLFASGQSLETTNSSYVVYISAGSFPLAIGIMTLECVFSSETEVERRFMCFPCNVPTKYYPIALVVLFSLFAIQLDIVFGMAAGYILGLISVVQPGINRIRSIENTAAVRRWSAEPLFFKVDNLAAGDFQPFGMGMFGQQQQQQQNAGNEQNSRPRGTHGSGRLGNVVGMRDLSSGGDGQQSQPPSSASVPSASSAARPSSAFSGQGYKLGAAASAAPTLGSGTSTAADAQAHSGLRSALADRYERLARASTSHSDTASPSTAITIVPESQSSESASGPVSEWPRRGPELAPMPIGSQAPAKKEKKSEKKPSRTNRNGYAPLSTEIDTMSDDEENPIEGGAGGSEEDNVRRLMDRGFTRDEAENALLVSNGNLQDALRFLNM